MSKRLKIYIGVFILVIGLMMYLEYAKPRPINWTATYSVRDKIPFGTYILYKELPKLFPEKKIKLIKETASSYLSMNSTPGTDNLYFIISQKPTLSKTDTDYLLNFVTSGNDVFIASTVIPDEILSKLNLKIESSYYVLKEDFSNIQLYLTHPAAKQSNYKFDKISNYSYFSKLSTDSTIILGEYKNPTSKKVNFIKQKYGKGYFYIHLFPEAYTNYFMLKDSNYTYATNSLNYITKKNILWEEKNKSITAAPDGILQHIFNNPPLHWAWIILLTGTFFYCLFFGKRLQRIIPIIKPLPNKTVEFTKTIGNLYYNNREHQDIIEKKIKYFLYFVKEHYFMDIEKIDDSFSDRLHLKSGVSREITNKIVSLIQKNQNHSFSTEEDLKIVNTTIDLFYKKTK